MASGAACSTAVVTVVVTNGSSLVTGYVKSTVGSASGGVGKSASS